MKRSDCCAAPLIDETDVCSKCKEHCSEEIIFEASATKTVAICDPLALWFAAKTDDIECNVYTQYNSMSLIVSINGECYKVDAAELVESLIEEVLGDADGSTSS